MVNGYKHLESFMFDDNLTLYLNVVGNWLDII